MLPVFVPLTKGEGGVGKDCVVDAGHIQTARIEDLGDRLGSLSRDKMAAVDRALLLSLGLF